jgi:large subunit ribosomal protein L17
MRHRKAGKQLGRNSAHRQAMLRNMVTSLIKHGEITTTDTKAKAVRPLVERIITLSKRGDLHARRRTISLLKEKRVAHSLFEELRSSVQNRQGGYISIVKKGYRKGDGAPISLIRIIDAKKASAKGEKKAKKGGEEGDKAKSAG